MRHVAVVQGTRRRDRESDLEYRARMSSALLMSGASVAWICIPPSPNTLLLASAAVDSGMHVIAEKPWSWTGPPTQALLAQARSSGILLGVHFEYCLLDAVEHWRRDRNRGAGLEFSGRFATRRPDRLGIPAVENLGSHLFAIHAYALPQSTISEILCGYEEPEARTVSIADSGRLIETIDFSVNHEPIIQRFVAKFESALGGGSFPFTLDFAMQVWESLDAFREKQTSK